MDNNTKNSNELSEELQHRYHQFETTLQSGQFSFEGLDYLVDQCNEVDPNRPESAIAILALTRNTSKFRVECEKLYEWACNKYGDDLINGTIQIYLDKAYLSALFKQQF